MRSLTGLTISVLLFTLFLPFHSLFSDEWSDMEDFADAGMQATLQTRVALAVSSPVYPVTPGDVYQLMLLRESKILTRQILAGDNYQVNLGEFGILDAAGMTSAKFRESVEALVAKSYPGSLPAVTLVSTGLFQFWLQGEVLNTKEHPGWGLTRLSDALRDRLTPYASIRNIRITSSDDTVQICDLYKAERLGQKKNNPFIRAGDRIFVERLDRSIELAGEVRRPGTYQLLPGEGIRDLIEFYGDGFTSLADKKLILLNRPVGPSQPLGSSLYIEVTEDGFPPTDLRNLDKVVVGSVLDKRAVAFFEGALRDDRFPPAPGGEESTQRIRYSFTPGTRISTAVKDLRDTFSQVSDLAISYILREGEKEPIPVDIEKLLLYRDDAQDEVLENGDVVIIPFRQYFITVAGAVMNPGRYPYVPNRTWKYYVNLAGGIDSTRNSDELLEITTKDDLVKTKDGFIEPEDKIYVASNDFVYKFSRSLSVIGHIASVITMILGVIAIFGF